MKYEDLQRVNEEINTVDIKGKAYSEVAQRIKAFRKLYPEGTIETEMISNIDGVCIFKATIGYYQTIVDGDKEIKTKHITLATGTAYEKENSTFINKTSYIENCETSAVGRALGMLGIGISESVASAEEVVNAINNQEITKEDAEKYILDFGKHAGKPLQDLPTSYLHWLYDNNEACRKMIDILGLIASDEDIEESTKTIQEILTLIDETGIDLEKIKTKYEIKGLTEATKQQLKEIKETLEKHKQIQEKTND